VRRENIGREGCGEEWKGMMDQMRIVRGEEKRRKGRLEREENGRKSIV
jgi:hypothetical protein